MLKAKARSIAGSPIYIIGLCPHNLRLIRQNQPVRFDGAEIELPQLWFIIALIRNTKDANAYQKIHSTPGKDALVFGLTRDGIAKPS